MPKPTTKELKALDKALEQIAFAEGHIANAKAWIRKAKRGKADDLEYHPSEALDEASTELETCSAELAQLF